MASKLKEYLKNPFLNRLYSDIRNAGPIRSILLDITHMCNLRCKGCYFFAEEMDKNKAPVNESEFDAFIDQEKERGTNFVTVTGGEPTLEIHRLKKLYDNFLTSVVTNGIQKIPFDGFEKLSIGVSVWGDHDTDKRLRGKGKIDVFAKGLENYKNDPRVGWYYTTTAGNASEIESVTEQCVANGNYLIYNFYGDILQIGADLDHQQGFEGVSREINRMIERYPDKLFCTSYMLDVITKGIMKDEKWGYDVCCSITFDNKKNEERIKNGKPFNPHFRAYNPDLKSTRRCCVGDDRDCSNCYDIWAHFSWIMMNMKRHLGSEQEYTYWLTTVYIFYVMNRFIDLEVGSKLQSEIHKHVSLFDKESI
jgi:MoaA/NifB/PqqE/SkfB family radical SAM enzyme